MAIKTMAEAFAAIECAPDSTFAMSDAATHTTLEHVDGYKIPHSAAFVLCNDKVFRDKMSAYTDEFVKMAKDNGASFYMQRPHTWRANPDWGDKLGVSLEDLIELNRVIIRLHMAIKEKYQTEEFPVYVAGVVGPRGDGYLVGDNKMTPEEAEQYHSLQVGILAEEGVDIINMYTCTYPEEAIGVVRAVHKAGKRAGVGFPIDKMGQLPCGMGLGEAIEKIDAATESKDPASKPLFYAINCTHVSHFLHLFKEKEKEPWMKRLLEVFPNPSDKTHEELTKLDKLDSGDPVEFGQLAAELKQACPSLRMFGACCGSNIDHLEQTALALKKLN